MSLNAFEALADLQMAAPAKRITERTTTPQTAAEKKLRDQQKLTAGYRQAHRKIWRTALEGEHGRKLADLKRTIGRFGPEQAEEFVAHVEGLDWPRQVDADTQAIALRLVSTRIMRIRMSVGLHPFDDSLPDEPDCAFTRCRKAILGR